MILPEAELTAILEDPSKAIDGDLYWTLRNDFGPFAFFQARVDSSEGWPIFIKGSHNHEASKLAFAIIHQGYGRRIYGLCLGYGHTNLDRSRAESPHKHRPRESDDKYAYAASDITATILDPLDVWSQFCREARITHRGRLHRLPSIQAELL